MKLIASGDMIGSHGTPWTPLGRTVADFERGLLHAWLVADYAVAQEARRMPVCGRAHSFFDADGVAGGSGCGASNWERFGTLPVLLVFTDAEKVSTAMTANLARADRVFHAPMDEGFRKRRHQAYELAYNAWLGALPEEEQRRLKDLDLDKPAAEQFGPVRRREEDEEFEREIADGELPTTRVADGPEIEAAIMKAMHWCLAAPSLVEIGQRWLVVMMIWRSPLIAGLQMEFERELAEEAAREVGDDDAGSGHVVEWVRRGGSVSQIGQRVMVAAYVLAPAIIGSASLEAIGRLSNKTRQAVNKVVQDFRDSFGGVRNRAMRDDSTRLLCKIAQLQDHYGEERFAVS